MLSFYSLIKAYLYRDTCFMFQSLVSHERILMFLSMQELYMYVSHCQFSWDLTTKIDKTLYNMTISLIKKWRPLSTIVVNIPSTSSWSHPLLCWSFLTYKFFSNQLSFILHKYFIVYLLLIHAFITKRRWKTGLEKNTHFDSLNNQHKSASLRVTCYTYTCSCILPPPLLSPLQTTTIPFLANFAIYCMIHCIIYHIILYCIHILFIKD